MSENNESEKKRGNVSRPRPNENSSLANPLLRRWSFNTQVLNVAQHPSSACSAYRLRGIDVRFELAIAHGSNLL